MLLAVAGFAGLSWYSVSAIRSHPGFGGFSTTNTNLIRVQLADRHYAIPAHYMEIPPRDGAKEKDLFLEVLWPSLKGRTRENYAQFRVGHPGEKIRILLKTYDHLPITATESVRNRLNIEKDGSAPLEAREPVDGLDRLVPVSGYTMIGRYEILIESKDREVTSFLACRPDGAVPYPSCSHWFALNDEIEAKVTYAKPFFLEWRQIRAGVTALLNDFEVTAPPHAATIPTNRLTNRLVKDPLIMASALASADCAALDDLVQKGDVIGYYAYLAGRGYDYGRLAAGLADNTTFNGQAARAFAAGVAEEEDPAGSGSRIARSGRLHAVRTFARFDSGRALV